jgi:hypothetical protein
MAHYWEFRRVNPLTMSVPLQRTTYPHVVDEGEGNQPFKNSREGSALPDRKVYAPIPTSPGHCV